MFENGKLNGEATLYAIGKEPAKTIWKQGIMVGAPTEKSVAGKNKATLKETVSQIVAAK